MTNPSATGLTTAADVADAFESFDAAVRSELLALRQLILETAAETSGVGDIEETLKWGQPSYLTSQTKSGSTIRLAPTNPGADGDHAMYFICHTNLVERFQVMFGDTLCYEANRALVFCVGSDVPENEVRHCVAMALTYHLAAS